MRSIFLLLCVPAIGAACSCSQILPVCSQTGPHSVIFAGTVVAISETEHYFRTVRFSIKEAFSGVGTYSQVEVRTARDEAACGVYFSPGQTYLVSASRLQDGSVETNLCMNSRPVASSSEDLRFLRNWKAGRSRTLIQGQLIPDSTPGWTTHARLMAKMATVRITGTDSLGRIYATTPDQNGHFSFEPKGAQPLLLRMSSPGLSASTNEWRLQPVPGGCSTVVALINFDGHVAGHVTEQGHRPGIRVKIELSPALPGTGGRGFETTTGPDGQYEFRGVPPGRYLLGVNLSEKMASPAVPWPVTSVPVEVGESQSVRDVNLTLPRRSAKRAIHVRAQWADGSPAKWVNVWSDPVGVSGVMILRNLAPPGTPLEKRIADHMITDENGRIDLTVLTDFVYRIQGSAGPDHPVVEKRGSAARPVLVQRGGDTSAVLTFSVARQD